MVGRTLDVVELGGVADLLAATGSDPVARASLRGCRFGGGYAAGGAACWAGLRDGDRPAAVTAVGPGPAVVGLLVEVHGVLPEPAWVSVPRDAVPHLAAAGLGIADRVDWDFRWRSGAPPRQPAEDAVTVLPPGADDAVAAFLAAASPTASARPGDPAVRRWVGAGDPLAAVAADTTGLPDVGHISSVATAPAARGRGLGAAVTAALARLQVAEGCEIVTLGLFAENDTARRLYTRLGFRDEHPRAAGRLVALSPAAARRPRPPAAGPR